MALSLWYDEADNELTQYDTTSFSSKQFNTVASSQKQSPYNAHYIYQRKYVGNCNVEQYKMQTIIRY